MKLKTAAVLTIKSPGRMHARGRRQIAGWLRRQAARLESKRRKQTDGQYRALWQYE